MNTKFYLSLIVATLILTSCLKQSIADAMLNKENEDKVIASLSYSINDEPVEISVDNAEQSAGNYTLICEKSNGYILGGNSSSGDLVLTIFTDSLKLESYTYTSNYGPLYVTSFQGRAQYVYGPTDYLTVQITSYKNGLISGNFSGRITPVIIPGYPNNVYGEFGSGIIKNGKFKNVPIIY